MGAREGGRREESEQESRAARMGEPDWSRRNRARGGIPVLFGSILVMVFLVWVCFQR